MQHRTEHMDWVLWLVGAGKASALRLAVEGDSFAATHRALRG